MSGMAVHGGSLSVGVALLGSTIGLGFLSQSSASPVSNVSSANTPLIGVAPTIREISNSEAKNTQIGDVPDSTTVKPEYTQKQLACAEKLGVDPSECTNDGGLIGQNKRSGTRHSVQKRSEPTEAQQTCATTLDVPVEACNSHGVFVNRDPAVSASILSQIDVDNWGNVTSNDLKDVVGLGFEGTASVMIRSRDIQLLPGFHALFLDSGNVTISRFVYDSTTTISLQKEYLDVLTIELNDEVAVPFSEVSQFYELVDTWDRLIEYLLDMPRLPETVESLSEKQAFFLFDVLGSELKKSEYDWAIQLYKHYQCYERAGLSPSECNIFGVFTNRSSAISDSILNQIGVDSWGNVTLGALANITTLNISDNALVSAKKNDFSDLPNLDYASFVNLFLSEISNQKNNLEFLTESYEENIELYQQDLEACSKELDEVKSNTGTISSSNSILMFTLAIAFLLAGQRIS